MKEVKKQFSRTKLNLELGEYGYEDYDYLKEILDRVLDNEMYFEAVNTHVYVLSVEYGPV